MTQKAISKRYRDCLEGADGEGEAVRHSAGAMPSARLWIRGNGKGGKGTAKGESKGKKGRPPDRMVPGMALGVTSHTRA